MYLFLEYCSLDVKPQTIHNSMPVNVFSHVLVECYADNTSAIILEVCLEWTLLGRNYNRVFYFPFLPVTSNTFPVVQFKHSLYASIYTYCWWTCETGTGHSTGAPEFTPVFMGSRCAIFTFLCCVLLLLTWHGQYNNQLIMEVWSFSQLNLQFNTTYDVIFIHNFKTFVVLSSIQCKETWTIIINLLW